jgi:putative NAD(P)-binding protein
LKDGRSIVRYGLVTDICPFILTEAAPLRHLGLVEVVLDKNPGFREPGRTGQSLVEQALEKGYEITAFVRIPARLLLDHERLRVVRGDVTDAAAVGEALAGQEAALSALGHGRSPSRVLPPLPSRRS